MRALLVLLPLLLAAAGPTQQTAEKILAEAGAGTRIGLVVVDDLGREIVAVRPEDRFVPASNTKMFTTAAAFTLLDMSAPDQTGGASVRLEGRDVILSGHGDARLSSTPDCTSDCLLELARKVASRTRIVRDVVGDDSAFPDERWPAGMSWNNMVTQYGTAISALTLDDNVTVLTVTPGKPGAPPVITGDGYYRIDNRALTVRAGKSDLTATRTPGSDLLRITGTIAAAAAPTSIRVGVDDPAHRAAWRFAALLRAEGVRVTGRVETRHRPLSPSDDPEARGGAAAPRAPEPPALARLVPPPLADDIRITNKVSQNLHAELLLRRAGSVSGSGSVADGRAAVIAMLDRAGLARSDYDFADGSGMSNYNRVTPRATVRFLRWTQMQPWGTAWRATLPVAGEDGTLARRFAGTPLAGKLFAKTGSLNASNALSGFFVAASGRIFTFSALANDMPQDASATAIVDRALLAIAAAN